MVLNTFKLKLSESTIMIMIIRFIHPMESIGAAGSLLTGPGCTQYVLQWSQTWTAAASGRAAVVTVAG